MARWLSPFGDRSGLAFPTVEWAHGLAPKRDRFDRPPPRFTTGDLGRGRLCVRLGCQPNDAWDTRCSQARAKATAHPEGRPTRGLQEPVREGVLLPGIVRLIHQRRTLSRLTDVSEFWLTLAVPPRTLDNAAPTDSIDSLLGQDVMEHMTKTGEKPSRAGSGADVYGSITRKGRA